MLTSGELQQLYDDASEAAMSDPSLDNHVAGLRAVERAARAAALREAAEVCDALRTQPLTAVGYDTDAAWRVGVRDAAHQLAAELRARAEVSNG